jgi:hypothetical protein
MCGNIQYKVTTKIGSVTLEESRHLLQPFRDDEGSQGRGLNWRFQSRIVLIRVMLDQYEEK